MEGEAGGGYGCDPSWRAPTRSQQGVSFAAGSAGRRPPSSPLRCRPVDWPPPHFHINHSLLACIGRASNWARQARRWRSGEGSWARASTAFLLALAFLECKGSIRGL